MTGFWILLLVVIYLIPSIIGLLYVMGQPDEEMGKWNWITFKQSIPSSPGDIGDCLLIVFTTSWHFFALFVKHLFRYFACDPKRFS